MSELVVVQEKRNAFSRFGASLKNTASSVVVAVVTTFGVVATNSAMAADSITALGEGASENISAALTVALGVFAIGIGILGAFKGYAYLKSGVNKA